MIGSCPLLQCSHAQLMMILINILHHLMVFLSRTEAELMKPFVQLHLTAECQNYSNIVKGSTLYIQSILIKDPNPSNAL